jgi:PEP-CTERM motif
MKPKVLGAAAIVAALGFAAPAAATLVGVTYWGTVFDGYDVTGVFGTAGANLDGDSYVAHYVFDTTQGDTYSSATYNYAYGGSAYGVASPLVSASVTINGNSVSIVGDYYAQIDGYNDGGFSEQFHLAEHYTNDGITVTNNYNDDSIWSNSGAIPSSLTKPFTYNVAPGDGTYSYVLISTYDYATGNYDTYTYADASLTRLTVGPVGSVPEPSTWAMMMLGFAGLGFAAWRRTSKGPISAIA